jgi:hypothetical protein
MINVYVRKWKSNSSTVELNTTAWSSLKNKVVVVVVTSVLLHLLGEYLISYSNFCTWEAMTSTDLHRPGIWSPILGTSLYKVFPGVWDEEKYCLRVDYGRVFIICIPYLPIVRFQPRRIFAPIYILIQVFHMIHLLYVIANLGASIVDICLSFLFLAAMSMPLASQIKFYVDFEELCSLMNSFHMLDSKFCKHV